VALDQGLGLDLLVVGDQHGGRVAAQAGDDDLADGAGVAGQGHGRVLVDLGERDAPTPGVPGILLNPCARQPGGGRTGEPNARGRLEQAAIELFIERGFEQTTVTDIAARAGLSVAFITTRGRRW